MPDAKVGGGLSTSVVFENPDVLKILKRNEEQMKRGGAVIMKEGGVAQYGLRRDSGMPKGKGYFGPLKTDKGVMTELSAADESGDFPLLVPTLTKDEVQLLTSGGQPTEEIYAKAKAWAESRKGQGRDPFATGEDLRMPVPEFAKGGDVHAKTGGIGKNVGRGMTGLTRSRQSLDPNEIQAMMLDVPASIGVPFAEAGAEYLRGNIEDAKFAAGVDAALTAVPVVGMAAKPAYRAVKSGVKKAAPAAREAARGALESAMESGAIQGPMYAVPKGKKIIAAPQDEALRIAQRNAAKPVSEGGLGLPKNNTPMDRARAMGFDTEAYKGMHPYDPNTGEVWGVRDGKFVPVANLGANPEVIQSIDPKRTSKMELGGRHAGFYGDKDIANSFAGYTSKNSAVFPVLLNMGKTTETFDSAGKYAGAFQFERPASMNNNINEYKRFQRAFFADSPSSGAVIRNTVDEGTIFIPREGRQVRSRFAAFDPARRDENDLLAGLAALGIGLPAASSLAGKDEDYAKGGIVKKAVSLIEEAFKGDMDAAGRAAAGREAAKYIKSQSQVKPSEAFGQLMEKGFKKTATTQADRTKVGGGNIGGASFSALSAVDPNYAGKVWGVGEATTAARLANLSTPETAWTTMLGSATQLKTNPIVFDKLKREFKAAMKEGKLSPELETKINKNLALTFGEGADIRDPGIWKQADTFEKRAALADIMMGQGIPPSKGGVALGGEKSGKGVIFRPTDILKAETEPGLLHPEHGGDVPTFAAGPRLFSLEKEFMYRPDLHPGFPVLMKGEDLGYSVTPTPTEVFLPDWHRRFKEMNPERQGPGYYDLALGVKGEGLPSQELSDAYIRHLLREGFKAGGTVKKMKKRSKNG
jgi:hypothetical protein